MKSYGSKAIKEDVDKPWLVSEILVQTRSKPERYSIPLEISFI